MKIKLTERCEDCKKAKALSDRLDELVGKRDELIRALWRNYADTLGADRERDWSDEDMDLWNTVTAHSAIQDRLSNSVIDGK